MLRSCLKKNVNLGSQAWRRFLLQLVKFPRKNLFMCNYNKELFLLIPYYFWQYKINLLSLGSFIKHTAINLKIMVIFLPLSLLMTIAAVTSPDMPLRVVSGFRMEDVRIKTDSVTDFSFVSKYGSAVEWQYFRKDSHIIEHRGNEWLRFSQRADTLELRHRETCREKRESRIILSPHVAADTVYSSDTRRDRSFLYSDSGSYIITQSRCPLLILAEGDTLHDVTAEKIRVSYCRRQISGDGETSKNLFPKFIETETTWRAGQDNSIPYAMTRSIERISKANDTTITVESVCFPRALNVVGSGFDRQYSRKGSKTPVYLQQTEQMKEAAEAPHFEVTGNSLHVSSTGKFNVIITDTAGRVLLTHSATDACVINISRFTGNEIVVSISNEAKHISRTIIPRHE